MSAFYQASARADGKWEVVANLTSEIAGVYTTEAEADVMVARLSNATQITIATIESLFHRGMRQ